MVKQKVVEPKKVNPKQLKASAQVYKPRSGTRIQLPPVNENDLTIWEWFFRSPELGHIGRSVANAMSRVSFIPTLKNGKKLLQTDGTPIDGVNSDLAEAAINSLERVKGATGKQSQIIASISGALAIVADTWLLAYYGDPYTAEPSNKKNAREMWITLPRANVNIIDLDLNTDEQMLEVKFSDRQAKPYKIRNRYKICRLWNPRFNDPTSADSWAESLLPDVRRLDQFYQALAATALSQLNAGIIVVPADQDPAPDNGEHTNENDEEDGTKEKPVFSEQLVDQMAAFVADSAQTLDGLSRIQPLTVALDSDVQMIEWIEIARQLDPGISKSIDDVRYRIAIASPYPAEKLLGQNQAKFYQGVHNVQQISQEEFRNIYDPMCEIIAEALTEFVLYDDLAGLDFSEAEYSQIVVGWDNSKLIAPPDNCDKLLKMRQVAPMSVSDEEIRLGCGLDAEMQGTAPVETAQTPANVKASVITEQDIENEYKTQLGLIADFTVYRMCERAGARLLSATNKPVYKELQKEFRAVDVAEIGQLDKVEEFAQKVGEDNASLFVAPLSGLNKQFMRLTEAAYPLATKEERMNAWHILADALVERAREVFFGKSTTNDCVSMVHSIPETILNNTLKALMKG